MKVIGESEESLEVELHVETGNPTSGVENINLRDYLISEGAGEEIYAQDSLATPMAEEMPSYAPAISLKIHSKYQVCTCCLEHSLQHAEACSYTSHSQRRRSLCIPIFKRVRFCACGLMT